MRDKGSAFPTMTNNQPPTMNEAVKTFKYFLPQVSQYIKRAKKHAEK